MFEHLNSMELAALLKVSGEIGTNPEYLSDLIWFESGWLPKKKNPGSSGRGLIQFMDFTAKEQSNESRVKFTGSQDLVNQYPDRYSQLLGPVLDYFNARKPPFPTRQELYMTVIWPTAKFWPLTKQFPWDAKTLRANHPIKTVGDYMGFVERNAARKQGKPIPKRKGTPTNSRTKPNTPNPGIDPITGRYVKKSNTALYLGIAGAIGIITFLI